MPYPASHRLRRGRFSEPGRLYLVTTVTHRRAPLFQQLKAARTVIRHVQTRPDEFDTLAWVLMPDHLHWLLQLESAGLAHVVHGFKSCSSAALIKAGLACGQVWQAGYHDRALSRWDAARTAARYLVTALNSAAPYFMRAKEVDLFGAKEAGGRVTDSVELSLKQEAVNANIGATNVLLQAKEVGLGLGELLRQGDMFGGTDPAVAAMALFIHQNNRSAKRMETAFKARPSSWKAKTPAIRQ